MKTNNRLSLSFLIGFLVLPIVPTSLVLAGEEQRAPPEARTAGTLGPAVMRAISEIQELMLNKLNEFGKLEASSH